MAAHTLAIAKASLAAGFMRLDPTSISRDQISKFHELLDASLSRCSPANIQRCKTWLMNNATPSAGRVTSVGKYLVALSKSQEQGEVDDIKRGKPSGRRRQLHILYLLNDLLHSAKYHAQSSTSFSILTANIQPHMVDLFSHAAQYKSEVYRRQHFRLRELIDVWEQHQLFHPQFFQKLRDTVDNAGKGISGGQNAQDGDLQLDGSSKSNRDVPFLMPATHGDPSAPFYELPAGNMMPHIVPNTGTPINSKQMRALQYIAGPADKGLAEAVKTFLKEADTIYGETSEDSEDEGISMELDDIGQLVLHDKETGEVTASESYYGWSKDFCEQLKKKDKEPLERSRSRERSTNRNRSPRKRRYSSSSPRSYSRSRSRSPPRRFRGGRGPAESRSRSRSPAVGFQRPRSRSHSRSRSARRSPPAPRPQFQQSPQPFPPPPPLPMAQQSSPPPPMPFPNTFHAGIPVPMGPGGLPIPPPRPPNYSGPWPPPPPPPPPSGMGGSPPPGFAPFVPPPPPPMGGQGFAGPSPPGMGGWPPPPPPPMQGQQQPGGQGGGGNGGGYGGNVNQWADPRRGDRGGRGGGPRGGWW